MPYLVAHTKSGAKWEEQNKTAQNKKYHEVPSGNILTTGYYNCNA